MKTYDYILIGSGPAAYKMSNLLANTKRDVLVIDGGEFGGTCPNYGCEPKIFLEGAARAVLQSQQLLGRGISQAATIDWSQLMQTKLDRFNPWPAQTREIIAKSHDVADGYAKFVDSQTIEVNGKQYTGDRIIIATGQHPNQLPVPGHEFTHTSTDVLSLTHLPQHVTFIGAGYVSMELATILGAAGADITIIDHSSRPLKAFPEDKANIVKQAMEDRGIEFMLNTTVKQIDRQDEGFIVETDHGEVPTDYVVNASGRRPNIDQLNLAAAKIETDRGGIVVDDHLQTTNPHVYAIGDVVSRPQPKLTPVAEFEGQYLFDYLEKGATSSVEYPVIATTAFTFPEIAEAGVRASDVVGKEGYTVKNLDLHYASLAAGQNDQSDKLTLVFHNEILVGANEVSDYAADDINNFLPVIGLKVTGKEYRRALIAIYPALADKVGGSL